MTFASSEIADVWRLIASSADRLVDVARELEAIDGAEALRWRPTASGANSVLALAHHTLENLEDNLIYTVPGVARGPGRDREGEFATDDASTERLIARWTELHQRAEATLAALPSATLLDQRVHPRRGEQSVMTVLVVTARHGAEHLGQAELTRDLFIAGQDGRAR